MSLRLRLRKLQRITNTSRPCEQCLASKKATSVFQDCLIAKGVNVQKSEGRNSSRFAMFECTQCGDRQIFNTSHLAEEDLILLHSLNAERWKLHACHGNDFSLELIRRYRHSANVIIKNMRQSYGKQLDEAYQVAVKSLKSFGFELFEEAPVRVI